MTVSVLFLFLTVPWVGLQCVIAAFPGQICLLMRRSRKFFFGGGGPTLTDFSGVWGNFLLVDEGRPQDLNATLSRPSSARQRNADDGPTLNAGLAAL